MASKKTAILSVRVVADSRGGVRGLQQAAAAVFGLERAAKSARAMTAGFFTSAPRIAFMATMFTSLAAAALSSVGSILSLGGALASIAPVALVLPGLLAAVGVAGGVLIAALKDAGTYLGDLAPQFSELQDSISVSFWERAAAPIRDMVTTLIPAVTGGLSNVANQLGGWAVAITGAVTSAEGMADIQGIINRTAEAIDLAGDGVGFFTSALLTLSNVGSVYLAPLATGFSNIAEQFNTWVQASYESGAIFAWIDNGLVQLGALWSALVSIAGIFAGVTRAATEAGGVGLVGFAAGLQAVNAAVNSPAFQGALVAVFSGANQAVAALGPGITALGAAFIALAPTIGAILPLATSAASILLEGIGAALSHPAFAGGLLAAFTGISGGVSSFGSVLAVLGPVLGSVLTLFGTLANAVMPVLAAILTAVLPIIGQLAAAFTPVVDVIGQGLLLAVTTILPPLANLAQQIIPLLAAAIITLVPALAPVAAQFLELAGSLISQLVPVVMQIAQQLFPLLVQVVLAVAPAIMTLISAVAPLITQLVSQLVPVVMNLVSNVFPAIVPVVQQAAAVFSQIITAISPIIEWLIPLFVSAVEGLLSTIVGVFNGIVNIIQGALSIVSGIVNVFVGLFTGNWQQLASGLQQIWSGLWQMIRGILETAWNGLLTWLQLGVGRALGLFKALPGKIGSALSGTASLLRNIGSRMIEGLIGGIKNMASRAVGAVKDVVGGAINGAKKLLGIKSPSRVFRQIGRFTSEGLAIGVNQMAPRAVRAVTTMTGKLTNAASGLTLETPAVRLQATPVPVTNQYAPATTRPGQTRPPINITINGAIDKVGTVRELRQLFREYDLLIGDAA